MTNSTTSCALHAHRRRSNHLLVALVWLHVPLNAAATAAIGNPWIDLMFASLGVALVVSATSYLSTSQAAIAITNAVALMVTISLLLAGFSGHHWQIDIHMYYFAALAMISIYCDWRAIVAAAATVAVHHLVLDYALPAAIYPGGTDLARVALHAVVLVIEAAALVWLGRTLETLFATSEATAAAARAAQSEAEKALAERVTAQADLQRKSAEAHDAWAEAKAAARNLEIAQAAERQQREEQARFEARVAAEQKQAVTLLATALRRLAVRDLTTRVEGAMPEAYGALRDDFNAALEQIERALARVRKSTDVMAGGTSELAGASNSLASRTEQQAARLEEAVAAITEVTTIVKQTAERARDASDLVAGTRVEAERSGDVVKSAVAAMGKIENSSREIGQIIGVIDEIAFQTNLLALNAGVEAARAGEAGRGFAVVASEVRQLAQRSADAARQIKALVRTAAGDVGEGVTLVGEAGRALQEIAGKVAQIDEVVTGISVNTREQSSSIGEITAAMTDIERLTQHNASMAEQATAASQELAEHAGGLAGLVKEFTVGSVAASHVPGRLAEQAA